MGGLPPAARSLQGHRDAARRVARRPRHDRRDRPTAELEGADVIEWESITVGRLARSAASHLPWSDGPQTIIVLAKQPRPGRVKTRLQSRFSPEEASELAAAALTDTLRAVRRSAAPRRVLVWDGDPF